MAASQPHSNVSKELDGLSRALEILREVDPEMPAQTLAALVHVGLHPNVTTTQLGEALGTTTSAASRIASRLGEWERFKKPGLNLMVSVANPRDRRERLLSLTSKGQRLMARVAEAMG